MTTPDLGATFAMAGHALVDHLLEAQKEDCRLPLLLVTAPDIIPDAVVRAALVAAINRMDNK